MLNLLLLLLISVFGIFPISGENELILVHILFRHGDKTPDTFSIYPKDPHKDEPYSPYGHGQLTNVGKVRMFNLGKFLRKRYENFLGDLNNNKTTELVYARSTDMERTQTSLKLVLTSLFSSNQTIKWHPNLDLQPPIPYFYQKSNEDEILNGFSCPRYLDRFYRYTESDLVKAKYQQYNETLNYLAENTGWNMTTFNYAFLTYILLKTQQEWGLQLPHWTERVFPTKLNEIILEQYKLFVGTQELGQMLNGYFLQKIINDTLEKINSGTARKLFLYAGHEVNLASLLLLLGLPLEDMPPYGSLIIFEVHRIENIVGIKLFYFLEPSQASGQLKLVECDEFCPIEKFIKTIQKYFATKEICFGIK